MDRLVVLQINLGHGKVAQDLLERTVTERGVDIVLISEQYRAARHGWFSDADCRAAVWASSARAVVSAYCRQPTTGWTWVEVRGYRIYSCYFSPNIDFESYRRGVDSLSESILRAGKPVIVGGDFNAKSSAWGAMVTDRRGVLLTEVIATCHLYVANIGNSFTYRRGSTGSVVDVTFVSETVADRVVDWRVLEDHTDSDHQYVSYSIGLERAAVVTRPFVLKGWVTRRLDADRLKAVLDTGGEDILEERSAASKEEALARFLALRCDSTMPRSSSKRRQSRTKGCLWWNSEIAGLRRGCKALRRKAQRPYATPETVSAYRLARQELRFQIKRSKERCWEQFLAILDQDPWGLPYRVVRQKLRGSTADLSPSDSALLRAVIGELFPRAGPQSSSPTGGRLDDETPVPNFTVEELGLVVQRLAANKAPGLDGIPNQVMSATIRHRPELLIDVYNAALAGGAFPEPWKRQRLVLIPKPSGGYRPLCLISVVAKVFERLILDRLEQFLEDPATGLLSENQYGFRKRRSTIDAVSHVVSTVRSAWSGSLKASRTVLMVCLDIKNAFNTARWDEILKALDGKIPSGLWKIIRSYLSDRRATHVGADGKVHEFEMTMGVPQGSVLGPALWNVFYDAILRLRLPTGCSIVAFADDVALLVEHKDPVLLKIHADEALRIVSDWIAGVGLTLAVEKTEAIRFSRHIHGECECVELMGQRIPYQTSLKYLGVVLDHRLSFKQHVEYATQRAHKVASEVGRLMPNIGGPKSARRRLYLEVAQSVLLYAAPVWAEALSIGSYRRKMASVQRTCALRVISGYRTVSEQAALVLASTPPIDLLAAERRTRYWGRDVEDHPGKEELREETLQRWQERWSSATEGAWTRRLVVNILPWCKRKHGGLSYRLTQILTGHGCFGAYLHRIGKEASAACHHCTTASTDDDVEHTVFSCPAWATQREVLQSSLGGALLSAETMVDQMLESAENWRAWQVFAETVMLAKEEAEREREPFRDTQSPP
jgi:retron-type reverse transcriptase